MRVPGTDTILPTGLVHEANLKIAGRRDPGVHGRVQFFGVPAKTMRRILVDRARRKRSGQVLLESGNQLGSSDALVLRQECRAEYTGCRHDDPVRRVAMKGVRQGRDLGRDRR